MKYRFSEKEASLRVHQSFGGVVTSLVDSETIPSTSANHYHYTVSTDRGHCNLRLLSFTLCLHSCFDPELCLTFAGQVAGMTLGLVFLAVAVITMATHLMTCVLRKGGIAKVSGRANGVPAS